MSFTNRGARSLGLRGNDQGYEYLMVRQAQNQNLLRVTEGRFQPQLLLAAVLILQLASFLLLPAGATAAEGTQTEPTLTDQSEPASDPFGQAANAPGQGMSIPLRADGSISSIADVLEEQNPDLEQIQAQIEAGEYEIPKLWLGQIIKNIEKDSHRFDRGLVKPITMLGDIQVLEGNYVGALDNFGRAIHVERVNAGLVSAGQIEIVYREAEVYRTLGDYATANEREEYAYHVLQRAHDPYSEDLLPGLFHLAGWYERTNNVFAARHLYQRAADVLVANGKARTMEAVPAWQGIARTYRLERFPTVYIDSSSSAGSSTNSMQPTYGPVSINNFPAGEHALQTIIQIYRDHDATAAEIAQAILDLADWHLLFEKTRDAFPLYQIAFEMMAEVEGFPAEDFFGQPKLIHYPAPVDPSAPDGIPESPVQGLVTLQFHVTERGAPRRLETLDSQPPGMMDFRVRKSVRASRFRPALVNGIPVPTENFVYTHRFAYYPQPTVAEAPETTQE